MISKKLKGEAGENDHLEFPVVAVSLSPGMQTDFFQSHNTWQKAIKMKAELMTLAK